MSSGNLWNGVGIGLHADTIIGPVKLDYAVGGHDRYAVYFSAGFDFLKGGCEHTCSRHSVPL